MRIVFVGAGNLATNLAEALQGVGCDVCQVYSRTASSAAALATRLQCPFTTDISRLLPDADLYITALTDAALPALIPQITVGKRSDALFVHTAGSLPMSVWEGHTAHFGVFYPMQTFSKARRVDFSSIPIFVEAADCLDAAFLTALAERLSSQVRYATTAQRQSLHLSAVFVCNFSNYMYSVGQQLLQEQGIPFDVMYPLLRETAQKVLSGIPPLEAQTGPAVRYDKNVIRKQLQWLAAHPQWQTLYETISKNIYDDKLRLNEDQSPRL